MVRVGRWVRIWVKVRFGLWVAYMKYEGVVTLTQTSEALTSWAADGDVLVQAGVEVFRRTVEVT